MCGRYAASSRNAELVEKFEIEVDRTTEPTRSVLVNPQDPPAGEPDYNLAPAKAGRVVLTRRPRGSGPDDPTVRPQRQLRLMTWGLVPSWSRSPKGGPRMINARAETLLANSVFGKAALTRRALVPADGWFEWQVSPVALDASGKARKQPFFIHRADGSPLAFAGLFEHWRDRLVADPDDPQAWLTTFTIITTAAEPGLDRIHDRQPLVLERHEWTTWLDPDRTEPAAVEPFLAPRPPGRFVGHPVDRAVGSSRVNGPQLVVPADPASLVGVVDPQTGEVLG
jgi:putative SOS response-associated peptidase YedK